MFLNLPYLKFVQSLHNFYFQQEQIPYQIKDHGFSTSLASSSSFSSSFRRISFAVCREADTQSLIPPGAERPVVHVDPTTGKADGPHRKKLRTYLGIVARDKVDVTYENWKEVPISQKDLIWDDIQAEFEIPEASNSRTKKKLLQTFKSDLARKWALATDQDGVDDTVCEKYDISKEKWTHFCKTRRDPSWEDVQKKAQAIQKQNTVPHVLSRGGYEYLEQKLLANKTKKKLEEVEQSGSIDPVIDPPSPIRRHVKWKMTRTKKTGEMMTEATKEITEKIDVLTVVIGCPEHYGRVHAAGVGVTIKQYFGSAPRTSHSSSLLPPEELQQLTQQIRDQLEESITKKPNAISVSVLDVISGLALPPEHLVGPSGPRVSTKESCVDPLGNDPETGDSDRCNLYIEANPARPVALGRVYEGLTVVHNTLLLPGHVKVGVEEVKDPDAPVPIPSEEVSLVGQAIHTFLGWPTHLVTWDATMFGVFNLDFLLYIKHEDLSKIAHGGQCLSISMLQLWILGHWQMVVIVPKEHLVVWFCLLHNRPDNYLKGIIISALKGLDDAPQPKSKAPARWIVAKCNRQKGSTECGYYIMHWMSTIILGSFRNNWEAYFNDPRPLEPERLKALRIQWAHYYLRLLPKTSALVQLPAVVSGDCIGKFVLVTSKFLTLLSLSCNSFSLCIILKKVPVTSKRNGIKQCEEQVKWKKKDLLRMELGNGVLVDVLRDQRNLGNKGDGNWKTVAYSTATQILSKHFGVHLMADNVKNRFKLWRTWYGIVSDILSQSGFDWDSTKYMIIVENEIAWNEYVKSHEEAKRFRFKVIPNWDDIVDLCAKDRATGLGAENALDADDIMSKETNEEESIHRIKFCHKKNIRPSKSGEKEGMISSMKEVAESLKEFVEVTKKKMENKKKDGDKRSSRVCRK
ncbi:hypothetical protein HKD37_16G045593 [Glycine soja]